MAVYTLRQLEAQLQKIVAVATTEMDADGDFVFRDEGGEVFMWGPRDTRHEFYDVQTIAEADHVMFLCPKCFERNGGAAGTHLVMVSFEGRDIPDNAGTRNADGKPSRWRASGTTVDDLVLTPSILLDAKRKPEEGCHWHGFVGSSGIPPGHAG